MQVAPRGGQHFSYLFGGPSNKYESVAVGIGSCGPHVDYFNDSEAPFDEMGALGYTYYSVRLKEWQRVFVFFYPRKCVRVFLDAWTGRFGGAIEDFDHEEFPPLPPRLVAEKAKFKDLYVSTAVARPF